MTKTKVDIFYQNEEVFQKKAEEIAALFSCKAICIENTEIQYDREKTIKKKSSKYGNGKEEPDKEGDDKAGIVSDSYLILDDNGLGFHADGQTLYGDFEKMLPRVGPHLQHEMIHRVARPEKEGMLAVDATAGMGEDSFILAASGYKVTMIEHNPVIALLLKDALERGMENEELRPILSRMELLEGESTELLGKLDFVPDIIYLDPMFPEKKKSGLAKKKLQLLQNLEEPCDEERELLQAAIDTGAQKIIIKRPPQGPFLAGVKPSHSLTRKAVRFDMIVKR